MDNVTHIQPHLKNPELWRILFISATLLGIYLSIIITGFQKIRKQHSLKLAAFLVVISALLLQLTGSLGNIQYLTLWLNSIGPTPALLIGPFSHQLYKMEKRRIMGIKNTSILLENIVLILRIEIRIKLEP